MNKLAILISLLPPVFASCGGTISAPTVTMDGFAQGTTYHLVLKTTDTAGLAHEVDSLFAAVDRSASLYNPNSLLSRINAGRTDSLDNVLAACLELGGRVSRESGGMFDLTVGPLVEGWGFSGGVYEGRPDVDSLLRYVGYRKISVADGRLKKEDPAMKLDLNSVAQGLTADLLARLMEGRGIGEYMVEIGGEIYARGTNAYGRPWRVAIDRPAEGNLTPGADIEVRLGISDRGLATSGNYRKFFVDGAGRKVVHTIDPRTGECVAGNLLSATVVAPTAAAADAYGTMMMVMGLEGSIEFLGERDDLMACLIYSDDRGAFRTYYTPNLKEHIIR